MAPQKPPPREQEQQIRARKSLLYDADESELPAVASGPRKPFAEYVRDTPAAPMSGGVKALLWGVGVVVALLLVAALLRSSRSRPRPASRTALAFPAPAPAAWSVASRAMAPPPVLRR